MSKLQRKSKVGKYAKPALRLTYQLLEHLITCGASAMLDSIFLPYRVRGVADAVRYAYGSEHGTECPHDFSLYPRETVSTTLSRLRSKGFTKRKGPPKKTVWQITQAGKKHFAAMPKKRGYKYILPSKDGKPRLVIFDIPEGKREHRDWIRARLLSCDYVPLQKSVWFGERPLPKEFYKELKDRNITHYIHVMGLEDFRYFKSKSD